MQIYKLVCNCCCHDKGKTTNSSRWCFADTCLATSLDRSRHRKHTLVSCVWDAGVLSVSASGCCACQSFLLPKQDFTTPRNTANLPGILNPFLKYGMGNILEFIWLARLIEQQHLFVNFSSSAVTRKLIASV